MPKNVEVIAIKLSTNISDTLLKNDILIVSKEKSYNKFDELLLIKSDNITAKTLINKNDINIKEVIGKIIEVSRIY